MTCRDTSCDECQPERASELLIHTMSLTDDGMVDLTFRVPVSEVFGRSLADINSEGSLYGWSGFFRDRAEAEGLAHTARLIGAGE